MKKRLHLFIIILTLGFLLLPNLGYSCGTRTEKSCCKKEISTKADKKNCCGNKSKKDNCGGKCGHSNCTNTIVINFSLITINDIEIKNNTFYFSVQKPKFYHSKTFISSGFTSIWLPPKIK